MTRGNATIRAYKLRRELSRAARATGAADALPDATPRPARSDDYLSCDTLTTRLMGG